MAQVGVQTLRANRSRFPELSPAKVAEMTAKQLNEQFSTLNSQSVIKNKTLRSITRILFLAPQWAEGQLRSEARGYGQLAKAPVDLARGKFRVGTIGTGMAKGVAAMFILNQVVNYALNQRFTWDNEEGHKLDAFIPGKLVGGRGFYFNPFEIAGEYAHSLMKHYERTHDAIDSAVAIGRGKLSPLAAGMETLRSGTDYAGRPFKKEDENGRPVKDTKTRILTSALTAMPFPIPLNSVLQRDANSPYMFSVNEEPGSVTKQALGSMGLKVSRALGPEEKARRDAASERSEISGSFPKSPYSGLRRALDNLDVAKTQDQATEDFEAKVKREIRTLIEERQEPGRDRQGAGRAQRQEHRARAVHREGRRDRGGVSQVAHAPAAGDLPSGPGRQGPESEAVSVAQPGAGALVSGRRCISRPSSSSGCRKSN